ncbi:MAG: hypothetical protein MAG715_00633 [Methanonatronarchaeales archaeon]|nr:hypothetical protein [Methanonatronarchaeales archaeon]
MRLAIFRPERLLRRSIDYCESRGFEVLAAPSIELYPRSDAMREFLSEVREGDPDIVVLTSQNSIRMLRDELGDEVVDELRGRTVAAIGTKTLRSLEERDIEVDIVPETFSSTGLVEALRPHEGSCVLVARSDRGDERLLEAGDFLELREFKIYEVGLPRDTSPIREVQDRAVRGEVDAFAFTSTMTVRNFLRVADEGGRVDEVRRALSDSVVAALGRPTEETLESLGVEVDVVPERYTFEGLVDAIEGLPAA